MRRSVTTLTGLALVLLASHADAASRGELHVKDLAGDANGLNSQSIGLPLPATATAPASLAGADIVSLDVTTKLKTVKGKKVPFATVVTVTLAGPVQKGVNYVVTATAPSTCDGENKRIQLGYQNAEALGVALAICQRPTGTGDSSTIGVTSVDEAKGKLSWILETPLMGQKPGHTLTDFEITSTVFVLGVFDEFRPKGTFTFAR